MGKMHPMGRFFLKIGEWATKVESWLALGAMGVSTGLFAWLGHQWGALASQGWPAVMFVAILAASLLTIALALAYMTFRGIRGKPAAAKPTEPAPQPTAGDAFVATGTVADPQPFNGKGLYVGEMNVAIGQLADRHILEITARCFNSTNHKIFVHKVDGEISVSESDNGASKPIGQLPPSLLVDDKVSAKDIKTDSEFLVVLEQRVQREIAEKIMSLTAGSSLSLSLGKMNIVVASQWDTRSTTRLPLWDGIRLYRDPDRIQSGRIIVMLAQPARITIGG